jgi:hypothetical protein
MGLFVVFYFVIHGFGDGNSIKQCSLYHWSWGSWCPKMYCGLSQLALFCMVLLVVIWCSFLQARNVAQLFWLLGLWGHTAVWFTAVSNPFKCKAFLSWLFEPQTPLCPNCDLSAGWHQDVGHINFQKKLCSFLYWKFSDQQTCFPSWR